MQVAFNQHLDILVNPHTSRCPVLSEEAQWSCDPEENCSLLAGPPQCLNDIWAEFRKADGRRRVRRSVWAEERKQHKRPNRASRLSSSSIRLGSSDMSAWNNMLHGDSTASVDGVSSEPNHVGSIETASHSSDMSLFAEQPKRGASTSEDALTV
jgi:hypothetical protein